MSKYHHLVTEYNRRNANWNDANSQAMGIFNRALDIGIWDQIKDKTAKESWEWLKNKYAKQSHLEVLEHFRFMKDQKFDLSDPNPQIAAFMHHFQALPDKFVSPAMACLILLSNLPLTTNPGQESVYQRMLENTFTGWTPESLTPDEVTTQIRDVWGARFGGFHPSQQPRKGATYDKGKAPANKLQQKQQTQVQRNTAIKGKGPNPQYSEQQSADSGSSQQKKKRPFRRGGKGKGKGAHNHMVGAPETYNSDFILASAAMHIADTPSLPAPTVHTVTSFSAAGPSTWHEKEKGPWKNPGWSTPPYPHVQRSRDLMSRLGVTPTIQTSKEFEGIASLEEVTDGTFGAPATKLGAYTLTEPPRAPTPEMAPLLDRMVIDVPSENEDTVSLGDEEGPIPDQSDLFGDEDGSFNPGVGPNPNYNGGSGESDYGEDPEMLCSPITEPAPLPPAPVAGSSRHRSFPEGYTMVKGMSAGYSGRWSDDHDAYEGPIDNELVHSCSHTSTLLTDPSTASISVDIGRSLDKYLAYEQINCNYVSHCADCKNNSKSLSSLIEWIVDSGASVHFTDNKSDFSELKLWPEKERPSAQTANGAAAIHGLGTVFVKTWVDNSPKPQTVTKSHLYPVFYMPGMGIRLLSMGLILKSNMHIKGDERTLRFVNAQTGAVKIVAVTKLFTNTIYWINSEILTGSELIAHKSLHRDDFDLWHRRLGHPGKQVFEKFESSTRNFPKSIEIPKNPPVCEGCAKGKMHSCSFPENSARATCLFQRIHSDLKEFAV